MREAGIERDFGDAGTILDVAALQRLVRWHGDQGEYEAAIA